jgi:tetratricopeptide (TPR) repeat protein
MKKNHLQPVSLSVARRFFRRIRFVTDVYFHGYQWTQRRFLHALQMLRQASQDSDRFAASIGYYILGDVHDFNHAPLAAMRAYRCSARLWPAAGPAWREMGLIHEALGQRGEAVRALRKAVRADPTDHLAVEDLKSFEEAPSAGPIYRVGDPFWQSSEFLAASRYSRAIAVLSGKRSLRANRYLARVYGALQETTRVLELWERIVKLKGRVEIEGADWFFLPPVIWNTPDFWRMLLQIAPRVDDWFVLKGHESLQGAGIHGRERFELFLRYHLARTRRDFTIAHELTTRHPEWREAAELAQRLKSR